MIQLYRNLRELGDNRAIFLDDVNQINFSNDGGSTTVKLGMRTSSRTKVTHLILDFFTFEEMSHFANDLQKLTLSKCVFRPRDYMEKVLRNRTQTSRPVDEDVETNAIKTRRGIPVTSNNPPAQPSPAAMVKSAPWLNSLSAAKAHDQAQKEASLQGTTLRLMDRLRADKPSSKPEGSNGAVNTKSDDDELLFEDDLGYTGNDAAATALVADRDRRRSTRAIVKRQITLTPEPEVVPESRKYSVVHGLGEPWDQPVTFPPEGRKRASVNHADLEKLDEGEWLNDSIIEFYIRWLFDQHTVSDSQVYTFSTYFYSTLTRSQAGLRRSNGLDYQAVKKWTAKDDIFGKDLVMIPINENLHWYLAVIINLPNIKRRMEHESGISPDDQVLAAQQSHEGNGASDAENPEQPVSKEPLTSEEVNNISERTSALQLDALEETHEQNVPEKPIENPAVTDLLGRGALVSAKDLESDDGIARRPNSSGSKKGKHKRIMPTRKYPLDQTAIIIMDPLGGTHTRTIANLKEYLVAEAADKRGMTVTKDDFQGIHARKGIPQQPNWYDCGVYILGYMDVLMRDPVVGAKRLLSQDFDEAKDWQGLIPVKMRDDIRGILQGLAKEQRAERDKAKREKAARKEKKAVRLAKAAQASGNSAQVDATAGGTQEPPSSSLPQPTAAEGEGKSTAQATAPQGSATTEKGPIPQHLAESTADDASVAAEVQVPVPATQAVTKES